MQKRSMRRNALPHERTGGVIVSFYVSDLYMDAGTDFVDEGVRCL